MPEKPSPRAAPPRGPTLADSIVPEKPSPRAARDSGPGRHRGEVTSVIETGASALTETGARTTRSNTCPVAVAAPD